MPPHPANVIRACHTLDPRRDVQSMVLESSAEQGRANSQQSERETVPEQGRTADTGFVRSVETDFN